MKDEKNTLKEQLGDIFIDIGKLTFAGVVLSAVFEMEKNKSLILLYGIGSTIILIITGLLFLNTKNKKQ
jgi:K+ transporter